MIDATVREIREMQTHSSSAVAAKAARSLTSLLSRDFRTVEEFHQSLERNSRLLRQANPSHAWLQSSQREIVDEVVESGASDLEDAKIRLEEVISETGQRIERATDAAGTKGAELLENDDTILTHDYSSTVRTMVTQAVSQGKEMNLYTTESRPRVFGRRMAREMGEIDELDVTLVVDSAAGHVLRDCDRVVIGMDCLVEDVVYNRVGTFGIASAASQLDVPVTVVGAAAKIVDGEFMFGNDYRDIVEVIREPTPTFSVKNPAYDATPVELIDTVLTENGPALAD